MDNVSKQSNTARLRAINNLSGKYIKVILGSLEEQGRVNPATRKAVLDAINDLIREVHTILDEAV